jgi:uncharacterized membrane protein
MSIASSLIVASVWMFIFRKMRSWNWFETLIVAHFPEPIRNLWEGWTNCAYCGGFWIALGVRAITTQTTLTYTENTPFFLTWIFDALVTAFIVLFYIRVLDCLASISKMKKGENLVVQKTPETPLVTS